MTRYLGKLTHDKNPNLENSISFLGVKETLLGDNVSNIGFFKKDYSRDEESFNTKTCAFDLVQIKIPKEFHNVVILDSVVPPAGLYEPEKIKTKMGYVYTQRIDLEQDRIGLVAMNIASKNDDGKMVFVDSSGKEYPAYDGTFNYTLSSSEGCYPVTLYDGIKPKIFKFRNHYFLPLILSNGSINFYAMESKNKLKKWIDDIYKFYQDLANMKKNPNENIIAVGAFSPIIYDNIFGLYITKDARLVIPSSNDFSIKQLSAKNL